MAVQHARERRERRRGEARRAILDAAEALLLEDGVESLSMRRVAARSGYALPTLYHHFGDKPGLVDALLEECFGDMLPRLRRADAGGAPADRVRALTRELVAFGLENPRHYQLLVAALQEGTEPPAAEDARLLIEGPLEQLRAEGRLCADDVEVCTQALWAFSHGLISLRTSRADLDWRPDLIDVALEVLVHGLIRDPARPEETP